jgi:hypothetical protein
MLGFVPGIHLLLSSAWSQEDADRRDKPGHDE